MKSSLLKIIAVASLVMASFGFAQDDSPAKKGGNIGFGIHAAFDYGMMYGFEEEDSDIDDDPSGIGFEAGLAGRFEMVNNLYFAPELNFSYISTDHKLNDLKRTYSSMGLEIPLLIRGVIQERFYVSAGPQINLALSNDYETEKKSINQGGITIENKFNDNVEQGTFSFGIAAGAGVRIYEGLFFDFRFYMGLSELFPDTDFIGGGTGNINEVSDNWSLINMAGAKMMTLKFGLSYWFN